MLILTEFRRAPAFHRIAMGSRAAIMPALATSLLSLPQFE
jgi:hypothetical protein